MRPAIGRSGTTGPRSPVTGLVSGHRRGDTGSTGRCRRCCAAAAIRLPPGRCRDQERLPPLGEGAVDRHGTHGSQQPLTTGVRAQVSSASTSSAAQASKKSAPSLWVWIGGAAALIAIFAAVVFSRQTQTPKVVEAPHVPVVVPPIIAPTPTPATPVVQPPDREERAKAALDAALEVQKTKPATSRDSGCLDQGAGNRRAARLSPRKRPRRCPRRRSNGPMRLRPR